MITQHAWIGLLLPLPAAAVLATGLARLLRPEQGAASPSAAPSRSRHISRLGGA